MEIVRDSHVGRNKIDEFKGLEDVNFADGVTKYNATQH